MTTTTNLTKETKSNVSSSDNQKGIKNHKTAAKHLEEAAKHHHDAAKHHAAGNHEEAFESTVKAQGHHILASEAQREDVKHHALNS